MTFNRISCGAPQSPEWYAARREFIGASDIAPMLGHSPWSGPLTVWMSKTADDHESDDNTGMAIGRALEPVITEWWARNIGDRAEMETFTLVHADEPRMACNLDAWGFIGDERVVVEAKSAHWKDRESVQAWIDGEAAPTGKWASYWLQVQQQLEVTGCDRGFLAILIDRSFFSVEIARDRQTGVFLRRQIGQWWAAYVDTGTMPPATAQDTATLSMVPSVEGKALDLHELAETVGELREVKGQIGALKKRKTALEAAIKSAMGDAEIATFGDEIKRVTWKTSQRAGRTVTYEPKSIRTFRS